MSRTQTDRVWRLVIAGRFIDDNFRFTNPICSKKEDFNVIKYNCFPSAHSISGQSRHKPNYPTNFLAKCNHIFSILVCK